MITMLDVNKMRNRRINKLKEKLSIVDQIKNEELQCNVWTKKLFLQFYRFFIRFTFNNCSKLCNELTFQL